MTTMIASAASTREKLLCARQAAAQVVQLSGGEKNAILLAMADAPSTTLLCLMVAAQGMLGYSLTSVIGAIPAEIFEGRQFGTIYGSLTLATIAGGAAGPWIGGLLYDATGGYSEAFLIAIACCG